MICCGETVKLYVYKIAYLDMLCDRHHGYKCASQLIMWYIHIYVTGIIRIVVRILATGITADSILYIDVHWWCGHDRWQIWAYIWLARLVPFSGLALMALETSDGSETPSSFVAVTRYSYSFIACTFLSVNSGSWQHTKSMLGDEFCGYMTWRSNIITI